MTPTETPVAVDSSATASLVADATVSEQIAAEQTAAIPSSAYRDRLNPWCVVRLSEQAPVTVARFRRRPDAEAHLRLLTQAKRDNFAIIFNHPAEQSAE